MKMRIAVFAAALTLAADVPASFERFIVPSMLDGSTGTSRSTTRLAQISTGNDVDAIKAWLARFFDK